MENRLISSIVDWMDFQIMYVIEWRKIDVDCRIFDRLD